MCSVWIELCSYDWFEQTKNYQRKSSKVTQKKILCSCLYYAENEMSNEILYYFYFLLHNKRSFYATIVYSFVTSVTKKVFQLLPAHEKKN